MSATAEGLLELNVWIGARLPRDANAQPVWRHGALLRIRGASRPVGWPVAEQGWDAMDEALKSKMFRCSTCGAVHPPQATALSIESQLRVGKLERSTL